MGNDLMEILIWRKEIMIGLEAALFKHDQLDGTVSVLPSIDILYDRKIRFSRCLVSLLIATCR